MNLVYLDTSNLALLSKIKDESPKQFQSFMEKWHSKNYTLGVSEAHIFEIVRHGSVLERNSRFALLKTMLPVRFERGIFPKEIIIALKRKGVFKFAVKDFAVHSSIFG